MEEMQQLATSIDRLTKLVWLALARASRPGGASTPSVFVWRPGGVSGGNVYATQAELDPAVFASQGPAEVQCDFSIDSSTPLNAATWRPSGIRDITLSALVAVPNGFSQVEITGPIDGIGSFRNIVILPPAVPVIVLNPNETAVFDFDNTTLVVPNHHHLGILIDATALDAFAGLTVRNGSLLLHLGSFASGGLLAVSASSGDSTAILNVEDTSEITSDVVSGDTSNLTFAISAQATLGTQAGVTGGALQIVYGLAAQIAYTDTNGSYAGPSPTNAQDAIDRLAALAVTLNGGTPIP